MSEQKTFQASPVQVKLKPWNPAYVLDHTADRLSGGHWTCPAERAEMGSARLHSVFLFPGPAWSQLRVGMKRKGEGYGGVDRDRGIQPAPETKAGR